MGRGYLESGVWKDGFAPSDLKGDNLEINPLKLDPTHKYHMYVAKVCPFAHSALIARTLKNLEDKISVSFIESEFSEQGWGFSSENPDPLHPTFKFLHQVYTSTKSDFTGKVTVPSLYDITDNKLVSIESMNCILLFNDFGDGVDLLAPSKDSSTSSEFDEVKKRILSTINGGPYMAAFAKKQEDYEKNCNIFFDSLEFFENRLSSNPFIFNSISLVDIRLFVTLIRWIYVYYFLFKLNKKSIEQYPNLKKFLRNFYQMKGIKENVDTLAYKIGYYKNMDTMNPNGTYPIGPDFDLNQTPSQN